MGNEKYLNKVTSQHKTKPKFMEWLRQNLELVDGIKGLIDDFEHEFDIYKAEGKQLDILGEIVGRSRSLDFQPADGSDPNLNDELYRIVQLAKISINQWDGTIPGVVELWKTLFPEYQIIIQDNQDMTMNLSIIGLTSKFEKELMSRGYIAPKPEGVRLKYEFYTHIYQADNTAFFAVNAGIYEHYLIDAKATVAEDTVVCGTLNVGVSSYLTSKITANAVAMPRDIGAKATLNVGTSSYSTSKITVSAVIMPRDIDTGATLNIGVVSKTSTHIRVDAEVKLNDIAVEVKQNLGLNVRSSKHYIIN